MIENEEIENIKTKIFSSRSFPSCYAIYLLR